MTKTQMADCAGVCIETFNNWLRPHQATLAAMGYPRVSGWLVFLQPSVYVRRVPLGEDV